MGRALCVFLSAALLLAGCRKLEPRALDSVRALASRVQPAFRPPADGVLSEAQLTMYLNVRRAAAGRLASPAADAEEYAWVRGRIIEALAALEAKRVTEAALDSYARAIAELRETRRVSRDARAARRLDAEIAGLERERAALRRRDAAAPGILQNASLVAPRRAEIESVGP